MSLRCICIRHFVFNSAGVVPQESSFHELFQDLGLNRGASVAAEHEEFLANVNRRALATNLMEILGKKNAALEEDIRTASLSINKLQILYEKQDLLLGKPRYANGAANPLYPGVGEHRLL